MGQTGLAPLLELSRDDLPAAIVASRSDLRAAMKESAARIGKEHAHLMDMVQACTRAELHRHEGYRTSGEYVAAALGISCWKAHKIVASATALEALPLIRTALENGSLHLDKVIELTRFATPETEKALVKWAARVTTGGIRKRAEARVAPDEEPLHIRRSRYLKGWMAWDGGAYHLEGMLPPEQGALVDAAITALARRLPDHPEYAADGAASNLDQRRADAFVHLAIGAPSGEVAHDIVLHAPLEDLADDPKGRVRFGDALLHQDTVHRLSCDARLSVVLEGKDGNALGIGHASRVVPRWLRNQMLYRDDHRCTFPGCEARSFLIPHHIRWVARGGPTDLDNLITICGHHHDLVHEYGWDVMLDEDGGPIWFKPGGMRYQPGIPPPDVPLDRPPDLPTLGELAGYSRLFDVLTLRACRPPSGRRRRQ